MLLFAPYLQPLHEDTCELERLRLNGKPENDVHGSDRLWGKWENW